MKVLYIAAECMPFAKAGGVGDVAGELPPALKEAGIDVEIVTPWYGRTAFDDFKVDFNGKVESVGAVRTELKGVPVNFIKNRTYFENDYSAGARAPFANPHLFRKDYSQPYVDSDSAIPFFDDAVRFSFFSEACLELIARKQPEIVHVNDWVLGYLFGRMVMRQMPQKRVLTIHNIGYQGNLGRSLIHGLSLEQLADNRSVGPLFKDPRPEWESVNVLRLRMELSDAVNTVSPHIQDRNRTAGGSGTLF